MKLLALRQTKTKTSPLFWSTLHGFRYAVDSPQTITMILLLEKRAIKCAPRSKLAREQPICHANAIKWCRPWGRPVWSMDIWKDLSKRKETYSNIIKTKNSLMGDEGKLVKVNFILKEKRNAQWQEKYWRTKFESECLCVTDEDHLDFKSILSSVDTSKIKGDIALLLEQQQMALTRNSSKGYWWHPK